MIHAYTDLTTWLQAKAEFTKAHPESSIAYSITDQDLTLLAKDAMAASGSTLRGGVVRPVDWPGTFRGQIAGTALLRSVGASYFSTMPDPEGDRGGGGGGNTPVLGDR